MGSNGQVFAGYSLAGYAGSHPERDAEERSCGGQEYEL